MIFKHCRTPSNKDSKEENLSSGRVTRNRTSATPSEDTSKLASASRGRPSTSSITVVPESDSSASSGRAAKQKEVEDSQLKVTPGNRKTRPESIVSETRSGRRGRGSAAQKDSQAGASESTQSSTMSRSTRSASQVSATSEDTTPVRRSSRSAVLYSQR